MLQSLRHDSAGTHKCRECCSLDAEQKNKLISKVVSLVLYFVYFDNECFKRLLSFDNLQ